MPVMDGITATKEIRRLEEVKAQAGFILPSSPPLEQLQQQTPAHTPSDTSSDKGKPAATPHRSSVIIVALTASSSQTDRLAALDAGCNDFLTKPVSWHWLNNKIVEWGSLKALQMWSEPRADMLRSLSAAQARSYGVAQRLQVPLSRGFWGGGGQIRHPVPTSLSGIEGGSGADTIDTGYGANSSKPNRAGFYDGLASPSLADFPDGSSVITHGFQRVSTAQAIAALMTPLQTPTIDDTGTPTPSLFRKVSKGKPRSRRQGPGIREAEDEGFQPGKLDVLRI